MVRFLSLLWHLLKDPIEVTVSWLPFGAWAMCVWPCIFYLPAARENPCTRVHEMVHFRQQRNQGGPVGLLLWLAEYVLLEAVRRLRGQPPERHPLEAPAYAAQRRCEAEGRAS